MSDVVLFDTSANDASTAFETKVASSQVRFECTSNQVARTAKNEVVALVDGTHLVHYKLGDQEINVAKTFKFEESRQITGHEAFLAFLGAL